MKETPAANVYDLRHGLIADLRETAHPTLVYGFTAIGFGIHHAKAGTAFGYVLPGDPVKILHDGDTTIVPGGRYFCIPARELIGFAGGGRGFMAYMLNWHGLPSIGGPLEDKGRLRYIDGCTDTLLIGPPIKGDPCFNLLHFPPGITQTKHTHPSIRVGMVHGGRGECVTAREVVPLHAGRIFVLWPDAIHAFNTYDSHMQLTVFHPDSDFGPTHEDHPMLRRTYVEGQSATERPDLHTREPELV